ncbi:MAG: hypothetical protein H8D23_41250 [Candidatus Brocadiales bacterium]|nr:hypothetical protein [Candidatus Brocadiales bacterium]
MKWVKYKKPDGCICRRSEFRAKKYDYEKLGWVKIDDKKKKEEKINEKDKTKIG